MGVDFTSFVKMQIQSDAQVGLCKAQNHYIIILVSKE